MIAVISSLLVLTYLVLVVLRIAKPRLMSWAHKLAATQTESTHGVDGRFLDENEVVENVGTQVAVQAKREQRIEGRLEARDWYELIEALRMESEPNSRPDKYDLTGLILKSNPLINDSNKQTKPAVQAGYGIKNDLSMPKIVSLDQFRENRNQKDRPAA